MTSKQFDSRPDNDPLDYASFGYKIIGDTTGYFFTDLETAQGPEADRLRQIFDIEDETAPKKRKRLKFVRFKADA